MIGVKSGSRIGIVDSSNKGKLALDVDFLPSILFRVWHRRGLLALPSPWLAVRVCGLFFLTRVIRYPHRYIRFPLLVASGTPHVRRGQPGLSWEQTCPRLAA